MNRNSKIVARLGDMQIRKPAIRKVTLEMKMVFFLPISSDNAPKVGDPINSPSM